METEKQRHRIGFDDLDDFRRMHDVFEAANYTQAGIVDSFGCNIRLSPTAADIPSLVARSSGGTSLETLARLFLLSMSTDLPTARRAVQPMSLESWQAAGLIELPDDSVVPLVRMLPYQGLLLACDSYRNSSTATHPDFVMGLTGSSLTLINATIRKSSRRTLDLGTGCGVQGFYATDHSESVCAVDRNPRAVNFATFNARFNGFTNIEFREGDLF